VAWVSDEPSGVAAAYEPPDAPGTQELVAMWVRPAARGRGVGDALVEAVVTEARRRQARAVTLWVVRDNAVAEQLYRRHGFLPTNEVQPVPGDPCREELRMRLDLRYP
jgi:GNAT superfamily N-acetyltransferase